MEKELIIGLLILFVVVVALLVYIHLLLKKMKRLKVDYFESLRSEVIEYDYTEEIPSIVKKFLKLFRT